MRLTCLLLGSSLLGSSLACTTIIVGKKASADGSVMCTHSNDGEGFQDPRLVHIPAADHPQGAMRPVFFAPESYPRYVGTARGNIPAYAPTGNHTAMQQIGHIPEVSHTYSYYEETYGAMNEHQLGIGESTCSGVFGTKPLGQGGKAMMSVDTLSQLAMERTMRSRDAVQLMGSLAEKYGFYGAGSFEGTAESLLVTDPNEGWIFHILPDDTGTSAVWAAQRVPDDHIGVVANAFMIREVNFSDPNYMGSASVHAIAQTKGWWKPSDGLLDFTKVYSDGEYAHKFYSGRRVWGVYNLLAPAQQFSPDYAEWRASKPFPATAPPTTKVSVADVAAAMRSYYEGTQFDQTVGLAAGPWGTPDHVAGGSAGGKVKGNWERTIGLYRTSDSYIAQSSPSMSQTGGVLWWGPHAAPYTVYVPFLPAAHGLPDATLGHPAALNKSTLFWGVRYLANVAQLKRNHMMGDISALQKSVHERALRVVADARKEAATLLASDAAPGRAAKALQRASSRLASDVVSQLWDLTDRLMFKFADGYITTVGPDGALHVASEPYPDDWLKAVGYTKGPPPVPPAPAAA
jgi:dipeptidase